MKKRLYIIAIMLMVVLLTVVLVACGVAEDTHNIKGTTDVTVRLDKDYTGIEVYSSSADVETVSSTEYKITKDDANLFDIIIQCADYQTQYLSFSSAELAEAIVVDVVMESTTYVVEIKVSGLKEDDIENVVILADDNIVDYEYNAKDRKFVLTGHVQYNVIQVDCEGYFITPVNPSYVYNLVKVNVSALAKDSGLAIINIINNNYDEFTVSYIAMGYESEYNYISVKPNESVSIIVDVDNYVFSMRSHGNAPDYKMDVLKFGLEDGYEEIIIETYIVSPGLICDLLVDEIVAFRINGYEVYTQEFTEGELIGKIRYVTDYGFRVGDVLNVFIEDSEGSTRYYYTVTEEDVENGTIAIKNEQVIVTPSSSLTIKYVDDDGNAITDTTRLEGLGLEVVRNDGFHEVLNPENGIIQYVYNSRNNISFENSENKYYITTNPHEIIYTNVLAGNSSVELVLEEFFNIDATFTYFDLEGVLQTYDEGLQFNADKDELELEQGYSSGEFRFSNETTYSYTVNRNSRNREIKLTKDFTKAPDDYWITDITLPRTVDGMTYNISTNTYDIEILILKYFEIEITLDHVGLQVSDGELYNYREYIRINLADANSTTLRVTRDFFNKRISLGYSPNISVYANQDNVGFLNITTEMYNQYLVGTPIVGIIHVREFTSDGQYGDDF